MAHIENDTQCHGEEAGVPPEASAVTPAEKRMIYDKLEENKKAKAVGGRTARLIMIAVAFGLLAAVLAIRLFPI